MMAIAPPTSCTRDFGCCADTQINTALRDTAAFSSLSKTPACCCCGLKQSARVAFRLEAPLSDLSEAIMWLLWLMICTCDEKCVCFSWPLTTSIAGVDWSELFVRHMDSFLKRIWDLTFISRYLFVRGPSCQPLFDDISRLDCLSSSNTDRLISLNYTQRKFGARIATR